VPTDRSEAVQVQGLKEFQAALRAIDLGRELSKAHRKVATRIADKARARALSAGSTLAITAPSIRPSGSQGQAAINLGGPRYPWALGAEFGGRRRPTTQQFKPWLGHEGYALFPTIRQSREETIEDYLKALDEIFHPAFPS
jgi:hypothetical protein